MQIQIQEVANTLLQWGPAGAAAVLMIVAEKKLRCRWDLSKGRDRKMCAWLYAGNWVFIAVLLTVVSIFWAVDRNKTKITMSGIVQDLRPSLKINDPTKELYTKVKIKSNWLQDVHWHYSNPNLPEQIEIRLEDGDDFNDYKIPMSMVDDVFNVHVVFMKNKLWLKTKKRVIELESIYSASGELKKPAVSNNKFNVSLISSAYADESVDISLVLDALESDDSFIRQSASQYVVNNVNRLIPVIEDNILSDDTSYIVRLGLVTALARASSPDFSDDRVWSLSENSEKKIFLLAFSEHPILATQSRRYLIRNVSDKYLKWLDGRCDLMKGGDSDKSDYCLFVALNLVYNLAITKWKESADKPISSEVYEVNKSIVILDEYSSLWEKVSAGKAIQFGKIFYGKALLSHELSKLKLEAGDAEGMNESKADSVFYFKEMLSFFEKEHVGEYAYPHHIKQANCYIVHKIQECFDNNLP